MNDVVGAFTPMMEALRRARYAAWHRPGIVTKDEDGRYRMSEVSATEWPAQQEFDTQYEAFEWAYYQTKAGGPRYKVQKVNEGIWEAIQAWMLNY